MKKYIIIGIWIVIAILIIIAKVYEAFPPKKTVDFQLLESYTVDTNEIREIWGKEGVPFTFFKQIKVFDNLKEYLLKQFYLEIPDIVFDYENNYMAISIGREIKELAYAGYREETYTTNSIVNGEVTFEEKYHENTMYVYVMDKIFFDDGFVGDSSTKFYIMEGSKKVYYGNTIQNINGIKFESGEITTEEIVHIGLGVIIAVSLIVVFIIRVVKKRKK